MTRGNTSFSTTPGAGSLGYSTDIEPQLMRRVNRCDLGHPDYSVASLQCPVCREMRPDRPVKPHQKNGQSGGLASAAKKRAEQ